MNISNESCRCPEAARPSRSYLFHAALLAVTLFGSGCYGTAVTMVADGGQPGEAVTSQTGGAGGRSPEAGDAGTGIDSLPDSSIRFATGTVCIGNTDCATGFCVDGVCCDTACTGSCRSCSVTGKVGTCTSVRNATDDTCTGGLTCDLSGVCLKDLGAACTGSGDCATGSCVDGVCCGSASCGTCQSCGIAGFLGSCTPTPRLTEDADSGCSGDSTCNGVSECRSKNGQVCKTDVECASHSCVDGLCCDTACTDTCYSCNQPGKEGICAALVGAEDVAATTTCSGSSYCDTDLVGKPICLGKLADGWPCSFNYECPGNFCGTYYRDGDGDGYGAERVRVCGHQPPLGTVREGGDCCDSDADTHPHVTTFSPTQNACKSFDFNCDGLEEKEFVATTACGSGFRFQFGGVDNDKRIYCR